MNVDVKFNTRYSGGKADFALEASVGYEQTEESVRDGNTVIIFTTAKCIVYSAANHVYL